MTENPLAESLSAEALVSKVVDEFLERLDLGEFGHRPMMPTPEGDVDRGRPGDGCPPSTGPVAVAQWRGAPRPPDTCAGDGGPGLGPHRFRLRHDHRTGLGPDAHHGGPHLDRPHHLDHRPHRRGAPGGLVELR